MKQESSNFNIPNFAIYIYTTKQWNVKGIRKIQGAQNFSQKVGFFNYAQICPKAHWMHIFDHSFFAHLKSNWNDNFHQPHMDVFYLS
jgi:hypothetical protein